MSRLLQIRKIFSEFLRDYPKPFLGLFALLCLEGLIVSGSVIALIPLADYLMDPTLTSPSKVTETVLVMVTSLQWEPGFLFFALLFFAINLLKGCLDVLTRYAILRIKYQVLRGLIGGTLSLFLQARWSFFSGAEQGKLLNTFNRELNTIGDTFGHLTTQFAQLFQLTVYLALPLWVNPVMTLSAMGLAVCLAVPFLLLHQTSYRLGRKNTETANVAMGVLSEALGAARLILGFARQSQTLQRYLNAFDDHTRATLRSQTLQAAIPSLFQPIAIVAGLSAMGIALSQGAAIAELAAVLFSLLRAMPVLSSLLQTNVSLSNFLPSYEQLLALREQAESSKDIQGIRKFHKIEQRLELRQVEFAYPGRSLTINKVSLQILPGKMTALVGESGSGKSTVTDILLGLQVPERGEVLLDGIPLFEWDRNSFRERIGYVPQDPQLFHTTLRENLLWSQPDASDAQIWEACRMANAQRFLQELPQGLDTVVGDRGVRLSGGQRQRIALARALLRNPELLILDEATSSLDTESELLIQESLDKVAHKTTMLVIAHRLSTIMKADCIHVLHEGRIVESGSYAELAQNSIQFGQMVRLQQFAA